MTQAKKAITGKICRAIVYLEALSLIPIPTRLLTKIKEDKLPVKAICPLGRAKAHKVEQFSYWIKTDFQIFELLRPKQVNNSLDLKLR